MQFYNGHISEQILNKKHLFRNLYLFHTALGRDKIISHLRMSLIHLRHNNYWFSCTNRGANMTEIISLLWKFQEERKINKYKPASVCFVRWNQKGTICAFWKYKRVLNAMKRFICLVLNKKETIKAQLYPLIVALWADVVSNFLRLCTACWKET